MGGGKFRRDGLAENDRTGFTQSLYTGGVEPGAVAIEQRRPHTRDHVGRIDHILHADWHAVDRRKRRMDLPALHQIFRGGTGRLRSNHSEGGDRRLPLVDLG